MGERKLLKPVQKLKCCIEKTYEVELQSSDSDLDENHKEDICLFRAMLEELQEIIKISTFYTERALILTPILLHHRKKNKRIWCLEPLSKEEQSIRKRAF